MGLQVGRLAFDSGLCTGCSICELVCSFMKFKVFNPKLSMIRVTYDYELGRVREVSICSQCGVCVASCPNNALVISNGIIVVDYNLCNGCIVCVNSCPNNAIKVVNGRPHKCDLCRGNPQCVRYCVRGALRVV